MKPPHPWNTGILLLLLLGLFQAEEKENRAWRPSMPPFAHLKERDSIKKSSIIMSSLVMGCVTLPNKYGPHGSPSSAYGINSQ